MESRLAAIFAANVVGYSRLMEEDEADLKFWHQMITGDTTDNIPGLKGYGKKKADAIIDGAAGYIDIVEEEVQKLYEKEFGDDYVDRMNEMAQLLWIRRAPNERKLVV